MLERTKIVLILSPVLVYLASSWLLRDLINSSEYSTSDIYVGQLIVFAVILGLYVACSRLRTASQLSPGMFFLPVVLLPAMTASVMQTDQLRYIWNGLNTIRGINPYSIAPVDSEEFLQVWWVGLINFPDIKTIYPPFAEILFGFCALINPFSWTGTFADPSSFDNLWQLEFGLGLLQGLALYLSLLLIGKRWALTYFTNPLVVICLIGNKHIEGLMIPFILLLFSRFFEKNVYIKGLIIACGIGVKWLPALLLPFLPSSHRKSLLWWRDCLIVCVGSLFCLFLLFQPAISGALLTSSERFAREWEFFAFIYAGLRWLSLSPDLAKSFLGAFGVVWALYLFCTRYISQKPLSSRLAALWLLIGFFVCMPTLHPWYLLSLLAVGLPYSNILATPILWPSLAFTSQTFYLDNSFPLGLQFAFYLIISVSIAYDAWRCRFYLFSLRFNHVRLKTGRVLNTFFWETRQ